jgi:Tol biopolymer transport system component
MRVSSAGGAATPATKLNPQIGQTFPTFLPDGRHLLLYGTAPSESIAGLYIASLDTGETTQLLQASSGAVFDKRSGHLLFVRDATLLAQPFNPKMLKLSGEPFPVAERVENLVTPGAVTFSVSDSGVLAYGGGASGQAGLQLAAVDRQGKTIGSVGPVANYRGVDLSPDGTRLAAHRHDGAGGDIWITDLSRGTTTRVTFDPTTENAAPIWSADGRRLAFGTYRNGKYSIAQKNVDSGAEDVLVEYDHQRPIHPTSWSPDGARIVAYTTGQRADLVLLALSERKVTPLLNGSYLEVFGQISPDGKWLAYSSDETGRMELYVQSFPALGTKQQISTAGGSFPRWRRDGRELFFMEPQALSSVMAVDVEPGDRALRISTPRRLFDSGYVPLPHTAPFHAYAVTPDGQRFYLPRPTSGSPEEATQAPIVVVHNWFEGVRR